VEKKLKTAVGKLKHQSIYELYEEDGGGQLTADKFSVNFW
jgi:hypothetical protein